MFIFHWLKNRKVGGGWSPETLFLKSWIKSLYCSGNLRKINVAQGFRVDIRVGWVPQMTEAQILYQVLFTMPVLLCTCVRHWPGSQEEANRALCFGYSDRCFPFFSQDILSFISEKGPITEGIFRTSGDIRAFRALKERLDSGTEVNLNNESVPVVASILKVGRVLISSTIRIPLNLCEQVLHHVYS